MVDYFVSEEIEKLEHQAQEHFQKGSYELALNYYEKIISSCKLDSKYYRQAGICSFQLKRYEIALDYLNKAIKYDNSDDQAYLYKAMIYNQRHESFLALESYNKSNDINPSYEAKKGIENAQSNCKFFFTIFLIVVIPSIITPIMVYIKNGVISYVLLVFAIYNFVILIIDKRKISIATIMITYMVAFLGIILLEVFDIF